MRASSRPDRPGRADFPSRGHSTRPGASGAATSPHAAARADRSSSAADPPGHRSSRVLPSVNRQPPGGDGRDQLRPVGSAEADVLLPFARRKLLWRVNIGGIELDGHLVNESGALSEHAARSFVSAGQCDRLVPECKGHHGGVGRASCGHRDGDATWPPSANHRTDDVAPHAWYVDEDNGERVCALCGLHGALERRPLTLVRVRIHNCSGGGCDEARAHDCEDRSTPAVHERAHGRIDKALAVEHERSLRLPHAPASASCENGARDGCHARSVSRCVLGWGRAAQSLLPSDRWPKDVRSARLLPDASASTTAFPDSRAWPPSREQAAWVDETGRLTSRPTTPSERFAFETLVPTASSPLDTSAEYWSPRRRTWTIGLAQPPKPHGGQPCVTF